MPKGKSVPTKRVTRVVAQEDFHCIVCTSGDYEDDNLIVICEYCQNCSHQKCYGSSIVQDVPESDWVCNNCTVFGYDQA